MVQLSPRATVWKAGWGFSVGAFALLLIMHIGLLSPLAQPDTPHPNPAQAIRVVMMNVDMTGYGAALAASISPDPVEGLYTYDASAPLLQGAGLRSMYSFSLYSYCAYVNRTYAGTCSPHATAMKLQPFTDIIGDIPANYSSLTTALIPDSTFKDSQYLGKVSRGAYYLLLLGTVISALVVALFFCCEPATLAFFEFIGSLLIFIGAIIWTTLVYKAKGIDHLLVGTPTASVPVGIKVSVGNAIHFAWVGWAFMIASTIFFCA